MAWRKVTITAFLLFAVLSCSVKQTAAAQNGHQETRENSERQQPKLPLYDTAPFDPSWRGPLPANYVGHDPKLLVSAMAGREQRQKSEYETTHDFEERAAQKATRPLFGTVKATDVLALDLDVAEQSYNADAGVLQAWVNLAPANVAKDQYNDADDALLLPRDIYETDKDKEYLGTNAVGATTTIYVSERTDTELIVSRIQRPLRVPRNEVFRPGGRLSDAVVAEFRVNSAEARDIRYRLHALMICKLIAPYLTQWDEHKSATFTSPFDETTHVQRIFVVPIALWFYDQKAGRVYQKIDLRANTTPPAS